MTIPSPGSPEPCCVRGQKHFVKGARGWLRELPKDQAEGLSEQRTRRNRYAERVDQAYSA